MNQFISCFRLISRNGYSGLEYGGKLNTQYIVLITTRRYKHYTKDEIFPIPYTYVSLINGEEYLVLSEDINNV